jgi:hypothetical protein
MGRQAKADWFPGVAENEAFDDGVEGGWAWAFSAGVSSSSPAGHRKRAKAIRARPSP